MKYCSKECQAADKLPKKPTTSNLYCPSTHASGSHQDVKPSKKTSESRTNAARNDGAGDGADVRPKVPSSTKTKSPTSPSTTKTKSPSGKSRSKPPGVCSECGKSGEVKKCARCWQVDYCGRDCQAKAWPEHGKVCKKMAKARKKAKEEEARVSDNQTVMEALEGCGVSNRSSLAPGIAPNMKMCPDCIKFTNKCSECGHQYRRHMEWLDACQRALSCDQELARAWKSVQKNGKGTQKGQRRRSTCI